MRNLPSGLATTTLVATGSEVSWTSVLRDHALVLVPVVTPPPAAGWVAAIDAVVGGVGGGAGLEEPADEPPNQPANGLGHPLPDCFDALESSGEAWGSDAEAVRVARAAFGTAGAIGSLPWASPAS